MALQESKEEKTSLSIEPGDIVMMQGLKARAEWNGQLAIVIAGLVKEKNRWPIETVNGKNALLKPENLKLYQKRAKKSFRNKVDDCCSEDRTQGG